jgi:hypothetical protein
MKHLPICWLAAILMIGSIGCSRNKSTTQSLEPDPQLYFGSYNSDGSLLKYEVFDTLVSVRMDPLLSGFDPDSFASHHAYLSGVSPRTLTSGGFYTYSIVSGYDLATVMSDLRQEPSVFMVNPVLIVSAGRGTLDNSLSVIYKNSTSGTEIDSLQVCFGLTASEILNDLAFDIYFLDFNGRTDKDISGIARDYFETGLCLVVEPNFQMKGVWLKSRF